jgi:hypothetical protein
MGRQVQVIKLNLTYTVIQGDAQGLGALGRILGHIAGHLLGRKPLIVLAVLSDEVAHVELLAPAGHQGHALVLVDHRAGHGHGGCGLLDRLLEQGGAELLGWWQHTGRADAAGSRVQADHGMEVDRPPLLVFSHLGEGDANCPSQLGLAHADRLGQGAVQIDGGPRPQPAGHGVPQHLGAGLVAADTQRLAQPRVVGVVTLPTARRFPGSCPRGSGHRDGSHPAVELEPQRLGVSAAILTGRATNVP